MDFIILFNLVRLEVFYCGQLVILEVDFGKKFASSAGFNEFYYVGLLVQNLFSCLEFLKPSLSLLEPKLLTKAFLAKES